MNRASRSQIFAFFLLGVFLHALWISAFHHHAIPGQSRANITRSELSSSSPVEDSRQHAAGDSQCLSCRLQRDFASKIRPSAPQLFAALQAPRREIALVDPIPCGSPLNVSNRAPPSL